MSDLFGNNKNVCKHITSILPNRLKGFTLVELAVVLVIIGLVVGGAMMGKSLIQQAEIRAAASQLQKMEISYNAFRLKYNCIVGDCPNATDFFGANYSATSLSCVMPNGNGNGNGNGLIDNGGAVGWFCESMPGAKSLSLSNLLPTSLTTPCWSDSSIFKGINDGCAYFYQGDLYGAETPVIKQNSISWFTISGGGYRGSTLSPVQSHLIDEKLDDGKPSTGKFRGFDAASATSGGAVVANSCVTSGVYNLNEDFTCRSLYYFK